jgi:hypothetical protein
VSHPMTIGSGGFDSCMYLVLGIILGLAGIFAVGFMLWLGYEQRATLLEREEEAPPNAPLPGPEPLEASPGVERDQAGENCKPR